MGLGLGRGVEWVDSALGEFVGTGSICPSARHGGGERFRADGRGGDHVRLVDTGEARLLDRVHLINNQRGVSCRPDTHDHGGALVSS
ncbi:hypothetical protein DFJ67_1089 [Asanoa ferruginea]|uniref:Uncharacterized protein n=1 Tax=Asanoa ferruginea TaxID=53367 RepID=A0A3D9ZE39_9ACTN|nr:hypothetical protein DFJ67_1089 [Asanoa ferruginea]